VFNICAYTCGNDALPAFDSVMWQLQPELFIVSKLPHALLVVNYMRRRFNFRVSWMCCGRCFLRCFLVLMNCSRFDVLLSSILSAQYRYAFCALLKLNLVSSDYVVLNKDDVMDHGKWKESIL